MDEDNNPQTPTNPPTTEAAAYLGILAGVALAFQRGWTEGGGGAAETKTTSVVNVATAASSHKPDPLPSRLVRFRHPCHEHKFFLLVNRFPRSVVCDNVQCMRPIQFSECFASCPRCSIDICAGCFARPLASDQVPVPLADSDSEVNEDTFFTPYRMRAKVETVKLRPQKHPRRHVTPAQVPTAAQNPAQADTFAGVSVSREHDDADDDDGDGDDDDEYIPNE